jgi:hypothetical protein
LQTLENNQRKSKRGIATGPAPIRELIVGPTMKLLLHFLQHYGQVAGGALGFPCMR